MNQSGAAYHMVYHLQGQSMNKATMHHYNNVHKADSRATYHFISQDIPLSILDPVDQPGSVEGYHSRVKEASPWLGLDLPPHVPRHLTEGQGIGGGAGGLLPPSNKLPYTQLSAVREQLHHHTTSHPCPLGLSSIQQLLPPPHGCNDSVLRGEGLPSPCQPPRGLELSCEGNRYDYERGCTTL